MLRVHFTAADLARTRVADGPDPLWEILLSVQQLAERRPDPALRASLTRECPRRRPALRTVLPLMPVRGYKVSAERCTRWFGWGSNRT